MTVFRFFLVCLLIVFSGCTPALKAKVEPQTIPQQSKVIFLRADGQQFTLSRYVQLVNVRELHTETGLLQGLVTLHNTDFDAAGEYLYVDVLFQFFDEQGLELEKSNWQPVELVPGMDEQVTQVAFSPKAADFKVYIRLPKKSHNE